MTVTVLAAMGIEARAVRRGLPPGAGLDVVRTGMGPVRAARAAAELGRSGRPDALAVAGVAGGLEPGVAPGTIVVADRVLDADGGVVAVLASAPLLAGELSRAGLPVQVGAVVSARRVVRGPERAAWRRTGALAVDTETAYALAAGWDIPTAVVRVVADTPRRELWTPASLATGRLALRHLRAAAPALARWGDALRPRRLLMAGPRSFCAGVERAISTVERALDRYGAPVYVRRQIVHNRHVVEELQERGAVFVSELSEVPDGATVILSAHGVSPVVRSEAAGRDLQVIDATCPLVAKVHHEVRRFAEKGYQVVMIGHPGHDETEGTLGEAEDMALVTSLDDVAGLVVRDPERLAYITQTTLSSDDVAAIVSGLSERFPGIVGPHAADICYATQNRQDAVTAIAGECDLVV
ncbi:MAG TPA: 4-hydroxy-3-methylbut-2-enyl diphosphate reductase, partial [Acidimicrobiales bacterium]|nr:4-hydroxy-3-methylbut-2-enyl diphosphate reductase [Acidimicrobiales bacterium]